MRIALILLTSLVILFPNAHGASSKADSAYEDAVRAHDFVGTAEQFRLYTNAAELGHPAAQYNVAMMYANGEAVNVDYQQSVYWFGKSARQGFAPAQYRLGEMVWFGMGGLRQNKTRAAGLFRAAAEQNDPDAQMNLAMLLGSGDGVDWNDSEALEWMRKAAENGHDSATALSNTLENSENRRFSPEVQAAYWRQQKNYWIEMAAAYGVREAEEKSQH